MAQGNAGRTRERSIIMSTQLGKISSVSFGLGGYQDCQFGLFLCLDFGGSGCWVEHTSGWDAATMECSEHAKWTEADRSKGHDELCRKVSQLLKDAKVRDVAGLKGKPVEATFEGPLGPIKTWRILKEVL